MSRINDGRKNAAAHQDDSGKYAALMSLVESFLAPDYKIPCWKIVTSRLDSMRTETTKTVKEEMIKASVFFTCIYKSAQHKLQKLSSIMIC